MGRRAHPILKLDRKFFQTDFEDYWQPLVRGSCWRSLGHFRMVSSGHETIPVNSSSGHSSSSRRICCNF